MIPGAYSARPSGDSRRESFQTDATSISEMTASDPALQLGPTLPARLHEASRSRWWDTEYVERVRTNCLRAPGKLAPLWLAELQDRHPTLAYVSVRPPPPPRPQGSRRRRAEHDDFDDAASGFSSPVEGSPRGQSYMTRGHDEHSLAGFSEHEEFDDVSGVDLHRATPHPDALYAFDTNQWVIVSVRPRHEGDFPDALPRSGSRRAPMAFGSTNAAQRSFLQDNDREREREPLCTAVHEHDEFDPIDPSTRTIRHHHLHTFPRSVPFPSFVAAEAGKLDLPSDRETASPSDRRSHRTGLRGSTYRSTAPSSNLRVYDEMPPALDLTACCLCRAFVVVSPAMPGIIPPEYLVKLCEDRAIFWARRYGTAPQPLRSYNTEEDMAELMEEGRPFANPTADDLVVRAVETIAGIVHNVLWKNNMQQIKNNTENFRDRLGRTAIVRGIFAILGFTWTEDFLVPPDTLGDRRRVHDADLQRHRLLRAWVELQAWLSEYRILHGPEISRPAPMSYVDTEDAYRPLQEMLGADYDQMPRRMPLPELAGGVSDEDRDLPWNALGLTREAFTPDVIRYAYYSQLHCDPQRTPHWFTHLEDLYTRAYDPRQPEDTHELRQLIYAERGHGRWGLKGLRGAVRTLGLDPGSSGREIGIRVDLDFWGQTERLDLRQRTLHEALFSAAFKLELEATQNTPARSGTRSATRGAAEDMRALAATIVRRAELCSSLSIVAEHLGSYVMKQLFKSSTTAAVEPMSLAQAYAMFKAKETVEDDVLVYLYKDMEDNGKPEEAQRLREALELIAAARRSVRLEKFLVTGKFEYRGLNDIRNVIHLASLG